MAFCRNRRTILLVSLFDTVSPQPHARLIREAQNNPFTIGRRDNRDASVHLLVPDAYAHTPVLRTPTFRDIEIRHHLDAGSDGCRQVFRRREGLAEESIDAVAHPQLALKRFNVNRAGSRTDRLREDRVYQTDDGRLESPIQHIIRLFVFDADRPPVLSCEIPISPVPCQKLLFAHQPLLDRHGFQ